MAGTTTPRGDASILSQYIGYITAAAKKYGVDPVLIGAIIMHESGGIAGAIQPNGRGRGLMQVDGGSHPEANNPLMTAKTPEGIAYQIDIGTKILSQALKAHPGNYQAAFQAYAGTGYKGPNGQSFLDELHALYTPAVAKVLGGSTGSGPGAGGNPLGGIPVIGSVIDLAQNVTGIGDVIGNVVGFFADRENLIALVLGLGGVALVIVGLGKAASESSVVREGAEAAALTA